VPKHITYLSLLSLSLILLGAVCARADQRSNATGGGPGPAPPLIVGQTGTPCPNATYTTIGAAVAAAAANQVIEICPALYAEQLVITKPLTLVGIPVNGVSRVLLQPTLVDLDGLATEAVITVMNTSNVIIQNLAIDASHNSVASCNPGVAGIHFFNASGTVQESAIFGGQLANPLSCTSLPFGNGFGVRVDSSQPGPFAVTIKKNSIHGYTANGVQVNGAGITADIAGNTISGIGPASGIFQFAIFLLLGAVGNISDNIITEGLCGPLSAADCIAERSEGVTLRAIGDGTVVDGNIITNAQSGIFINGANKLRVTNNQIRNIDAMSGMDIQATASGYFTNSVIAGNSIHNVGPIDINASNDEEGCGINEYSGTGIFSGNQIFQNTVNDAYCGVAHVTTDSVEAGTYLNTLYAELNSDLFPSMFPPPTEP
jgi:nitrous oxidase accessory protein NosD